MADEVSRERRDWIQKLKAEVWREGFETGLSIGFVIGEGYRETPDWRNPYE